MKDRKIQKLMLLSVITVLFQSPVSLQAQDEDSAALIAIIDEIEKGWEQGDGAPFRKHYLDFAGARYVESRGQNAGLSDLAEHHVESEGDALDDFCCLCQMLKHTSRVTSPGRSRMLTSKL